MPDLHDIRALVRVIESLQERIRRDGDTIGSNEIRTRTALVDPLLNALGWDTTNPGMVVPEYPAGGGAADYALLNATPGWNSPVIAFIEAKRLNEPLGSHRAQMLTYANMAGVRYAGLTNGDRWELYEVFKETSLYERCIVDISIHRESAFDCAVQLMPLKWPSPERGIPFTARDAEILLLHAFGQGTEAIIRLLIDRAADIEVMDHEGRTLLHRAASFNSSRVIRMLIDRGADIEARDHEGRTPLHCAASFNSSPDAIAFLVNQEAGIETKTFAGRTPLYEAVINNTPAVVNLLLDLGADINAADNQGLTLLHRAVLEGLCEQKIDRLVDRLATIESLLLRGADPTAIDIRGQTPYQLAKNEGADEQILRLLPKT